MERGRKRFESTWQFFYERLTSRQRQALDAILKHRTMKKAAFQAGMAPSNLRKVMRTIAKKAGIILDSWPRIFI